MSLDVAPHSASSTFFVAGGTLRRDASCYVIRQADTDLYESLLSGEFCYVLNSRQMGKSSLMVRTRERLREQGVSVATLDLQGIGQNLSPEQWYDGLLLTLGKQLRIEDELEDFWEDNPRYGPLQRFFEAIREVALKQGTGNREQGTAHFPNAQYPTPNASHLVIFVDEIDIIRTLPFSADEFFMGIRECFVGRATNSLLNRLVFCLIGTATPAELIQDTRTSPFNIGKRIEVRDFTDAEAASLAQGLGANGQALLARVLYWTGGHPYLTQRLCRAVAEAFTPDSPQDWGVGGAALVDKLCTELFLTHKAKESDDNLMFVRNRLLKSEVDLAALLDLYQKMQRGKRVPDDETNPLTSVLKLSGVARVENGLLKVRNRIYDQVFDREWVTAHIPDAELRRQKAAFRRGQLRAMAVSSVILAIMGVLTGVALSLKRQSDANARRADTNAAHADKNASRARAETEESEYNLYIANMHLAAHEWENGNVRTAVELVEACRPKQGYKDWRGFEWDYLQRLCHLDLLTMRHNGPVNSAVYFADGQRIVTASDDHTAKVWDARTGHVLLTLEGHTDKVTSVAISTDGKQIVTGSDDHTARIWDARTGRLLRQFKGHTGKVYCVAISPDGKRIATAGSDMTAKVWDTATGHEMFALKGHTDAVTRINFSTDGKRIATASQDGTAKIWNARTGSRQHSIEYTLHETKCPVYIAAFSPDSKRILVGGWGDSLKVFDAASGHESLSIPIIGGVNAGSFSADGTRIVTGGGDGVVRLWDARTGRKTLTLKGHTHWILSAIFSPDSTRILTASYDGTAKVWDATGTHERLTFKGHTRPIRSVAFSPDGKRILTGGGDHTARVWDAQTGKKMLTIQGHTAPVVSVAFSPDGRRIVTGSADKTAKVWDARTGQKLLTLKGHTDEVLCMALSADGKWIATGSRDLTAIVWDAKTGIRRLTLRGGHSQDAHTIGRAGWIWAIAFSPDGERIVTGSEDRTAIVWDATNGRVIRKLGGFDWAVSSVAFSPDGTRIAGVGSPGPKVWDAATYREMYTLKGTVRTIAFSPDGRRIVTSDDMVKVWDATTGHETLGRETLTLTSGISMTAAFSPDGKRIAAGYVDGRIILWSSDDGEKQAPAGK